MQTTHQQQNRRSLKEKLLNLLRLTGQLRVKLYDGYGHDHQLVVFGHVLKRSPLPRRRYRNGVLRNTLALLRLFMVKPAAGVKVELEWKGKTFSACSDTDGFFRIEWQDQPPYETGWCRVTVKAVDGKSTLVKGEASVYIPEPSEYIFISDIDDTFLISHSKNLRKRLFVLFTNNARSRRPFEGVVQHYQLLQKWSPHARPNPFFYVSSSEWNLYDYLVEFTRMNNLPRGIFLLNQLKSFSQLLNTGQNQHHTKFNRIVRIMEAFPHQRVVLLGDSSQQDPYIYQAIVKHFPKQVHAIYIRDVYHKNRSAVAAVLRDIEQAGVPCCFFSHSSEAILHSVKIGLIPATEVQELTETNSD